MLCFSLYSQIISQLFAKAYLCLNQLHAVIDNIFMREWIHIIELTFQNVSTLLCHRLFTSKSETVTKALFFLSKVNFSLFTWIINVILWWKHANRKWYVAYFYTYTLVKMKQSNLQAQRIKTTHCKTGKSSTQSRTRTDILTW